MINRASLQAAFDLLEFLQSRGLKCVIAGGCARDIFFGVRPKDVDIVVVDTTMGDLDGILIEANVANQMLHMYHQGESSDRIMGCFKLKDVDIDVVLYDCAEVSEAIDAFDFNLNQFVISGAQHGIDRATVRFVGAEHWSRFVSVRKDYSVTRHMKMWNKYRDLTPRRATGESLDEAPVGGADGTY